MKRLLWAVLLGFVVVVAAGCNTIHGLGKDIEKGGEAIQRSANK
ncbi:MAG: entericidin A/B family lipoprotein [Rhodocyclales bacterium]|nr:entericidin A/B family lipoprotein [Rhodocyclales bacterium]